MTDRIRKYKVYICEVLLFAALLAVDLISKSAAFDFLGSQGGSYVVFDGIYELVEVHNDGASFGIFSGQTAVLSIFTAIAMAVLGAVLLWRPKSPRLFRLGVIAIIAGGVGNLVDRLAFGYVRDFIDYKFLETFFGIKNFGVGNVADIFVLVGLLCIVVYVFFGYKEGDFAKEPHHSDTLPDALVVNEGEEKKDKKKEEKEGVVSFVDESVNGGSAAVEEKPSVENNEADIVSENVHTKKGQKPAKSRRNSASNDRGRSDAAKDGVR